MPSLAIVAFDGFTDIDVFLHWDLLNRVGQLFPEQHPDWQVRLLGTADSHVSRAGLAIPMHGLIDEAGSADAVLHASGQATRGLMWDLDYLSGLALDPGRQLVASQCSGALVLGACGVLEGLTATTYPSARQALEELGVTVVEEPFVAHERVATAAGCLAGIELSRWLISKLADQETAEACINSASPIGAGLSF
ncbi:MAG: DJ-1/PfpI family protein [Pseudomonadota bacterium]